MSTWLLESLILLDEKDNRFSEQYPRRFVLGKIVFIVRRADCNPENSLLGSAYAIDIYIKN